MKNITVLLASIFIVSSGYCQSISSSVVASAGGYKEAGGISLSWTLGELATETFVTTDLILSQGFQQGYYEVTAIDDPLSKTIGLKVFPNPAIDFINIQIEDQDVKKVKIELYNMEGKLVHNEEWVNNGTVYQLHISNFNSSQYILRIIDEKKGAVQSYIIVKR